MSATPRRFTLLEFVKAKMPGRWAAYSKHADDGWIMPGYPAELAVSAAQTPEIRDARTRALAEERAIVEKLKALLSRREVLADDAEGKEVLLGRRHYAGAKFDIGNNAIQHGDRCWTAIEVREALKAGPHSVSETVVKTAPSLGRRRGRKGIVRASATEWLKSHYPSGVPQTKKNIELLAELEAAGINISEKTLRRALE
jgi:hypothetical protein